MAEPLTERLGLVAVFRRLGFSAFLALDLADVWLDLQLVHRLRGMGEHGHAALMAITTLVSLAGGRRRWPLLSRGDEETS